MGRLRCFSWPMYLKSSCCLEDPTIHTRLASLCARKIKQANVLPSKYWGAQTIFKKVFPKSSRGTGYTSTYKPWCSSHLTRVPPHALWQEEHILSVSVLGHPLPHQHPHQKRQPNKEANAEHRRRARLQRYPAGGTSPLGTLGTASLLQDKCEKWWNQISKSWECLEMAAYQK